MKENVKITDRQMTAITTLFICSSTVIITSAAAARVAGTDAWLCGLVTMLLGLPVIWINTYLGGLYPEQTIIEIIQHLLGKWVGGFFAFNLIFMSVLAGTQMIWYAGDFITTNQLTETPVYAVNFLFWLVVLIAILYGLEVIARISEIFLMMILPLFGIVVGLLIPNIRVDNLFPILENGLTPVFKGAVELLAFSVLPIILLNSIYPVNVRQPQTAKKAMLKGYLYATGIIFIAILMCILVLGRGVTASTRFPVFVLTKEINVGIIFSRLEVLIQIVWLSQILGANMIYAYGGIVGLTRLLKLQDYRKITIPLALLVLLYSGFIYWNVPYEMDWDTYVWLPYITTLGLLLPVALLVIALIRRALGKE